MLSLLSYNNAGGGLQSSIRIVWTSPQSLSVVGGTLWVSKDSVVKRSISPFDLKLHWKVNREFNVIFKVCAKKADGEMNVLI